MHVSLLINSYKQYEKKDWKSFGKSRVLYAIFKMTPS